MLMSVVNWVDTSNSVNVNYDDMKWLKGPSILHIKICVQVFIGE